MRRRAATRHANLIILECHGERKVGVGPVDEKGMRDAND
jgi:hypothetical protein